MINLLALSILAQDLVVSVDLFLVDSTEVEALIVWLVGNELRFLLEALGYVVGGDGLGGAKFVSIS